MASLCRATVGSTNDNLLPLSHTWALEEDDKQEYITATVHVTKQLSPWANLAEAWSSPDLHQTLISLRKRGSNEEGDLCMVLTTPSSIPDVPAFHLYWDERTTFCLHFDVTFQQVVDRPATQRARFINSSMMRRSFRSLLTISMYRWPSDV